jgi:hypothetical protein
MALSLNTLLPIYCQTLKRLQDDLWRSEGHHVPSCSLLPHILKLWNPGQLNWHSTLRAASLGSLNGTREGEQI